MKTLILLRTLWMLRSARIARSVVARNIAISYGFNAVSVRETLDNNVTRNSGQWRGIDTVFRGFKHAIYLYATVNKRSVEK